MTGKKSENSICGHKIQWHVAAGQISFLATFQPRELYGVSHMKHRPGEPVARPFGQPRPQCSDSVLQGLGALG